MYEFIAHLHIAPRSRMCGIYFHSPNTPSWRGVQSKHRDNFTFYKERLL